MRVRRPRCVPFAGGVGHPVGVAEELVEDPLRDLVLVQRSLHVSDEELVVRVKGNEVLAPVIRNEQAQGFHHLRQLQPYAPPQLKGFNHAVPCFLF